MNVSVFWQIIFTKRILRATRTRAGRASDCLFLLHLRSQFVMSDSGFN